MVNYIFFGHLRRREGYNTFDKYSFVAKIWPSLKEIVERRHGEPIKFLFLPKMGLLGSHAGNEKKMLVVNYEQLFRAVFSCFHGQKLRFLFFLHFRVRTKRLLDTKVKFFFKNLESIFGGLKIVFFRASCFGFRVKGVCPLLLPLVSLPSLAKILGL
jgi:hypothetical protein